MIGELATRDSGAGRQFKPQIHQGRGRGQNRGNYDRYMISEAIRADIGQIVETEDNIDRTEIGLGTNKIIGEVISEVTQEILTDRMSEESIEIITGVKVMTETGTGLEKGHFLEAIVAIGIGVQAITGPGQD